MRFFVKFKEIYPFTERYVLENPATESEIVKSYQAIAQDGSVITGTFDGATRAELQAEAEERLQQDSNLQKGIDKEVAQRVEAQNTLQSSINVLTNKVGVVATVTNQLFVVTGVSNTSNNMIELHLLFAHGTVFEVQSASLFYWGVDVSNLRISDGKTFTVPAEITNGMIRIHLEQMVMLDSSYIYAGVGKCLIQTT